MRRIAVLSLVPLALLAACLAPDEPSATSSAEEELTVEARHRRLSAGAWHACVITRAGGVRCWGAGTDGQLGDGGTSDRVAPVDVALPARAIAVAAGSRHTCAALDDGRVACWGKGTSGQLGSATDSATPLVVAGVSGAVDLHAGYDFSCALLGSGRVSCWGRNIRGELGNGATTSTPTPGAVVVESGQPLGNVVSLHGIGARTCARDRDNATWCWGENAQNLSSSAFPRAFYPFAFSAMIPGGDRLAITDTSYCTTYDGTVNCDGPFDFFASGQAPGPQLELRERAVCWTTPTGTVRCGGDNHHGQRGLGHDDELSGASAVPFLGTSVEVVVGIHFACALSVEGTVRCWGRGDRGQTGDGATSIADRLAPVVVAGGPAGGIWELALGGASTVTRACALRGDGTARCLGHNTTAALGNGTTTSTLTPSGVFGLTGTAALSGGAGHTCALLADGGASCWGANDRGQVGDASYVQRATPSAVRDLAGATAIAAGALHTCAARSDGRVLCWGDNQSYQLGQTTGSVLAYPKPRLLQVPTGVVTVESGADHSCAITRAGGVWCWGRNSSGQTGAGVADARRPAAQVSGLDDVVDLALGGMHTCALLADGTVRCWGDNIVGQLGDGTTTMRLSPVTPALDRVVALAAGNAHTCALRDDGTVRCWGYNAEGELGLEGGGLRSSPVTVTGSDRFVAIAAGGRATCGLRADGTTACWGRIGDRQLALRSSTPTTVDGL